MLNRITKLLFWLFFISLFSMFLEACSIKSNNKINIAIEKSLNRIDEYHQNEAAFADTLMYYLTNCCVYDEDDGFLIHYDDCNYLYKNSLKKVTNDYHFYDSLNEAIKANLTDGEIVYTLGYYQKYDGGCARYLVNSTKSSDIAIEDNKRYFNYESAQNKVNLFQMGYKEDDLIVCQKQFESFKKINTLIFPKGEYALYDVIRTCRDNVNYFGIEAIIYSADNFGGNLNKTYDALWSVRKAWGSQDVIFDQTYSDLHFEMRQKKYNDKITDLKGLSYLMMIAYCQNINIYNCHFFIPKGLYDGDLKKYASDCFDCFTDWHNVTFENCSFENYSYANAGGAIGFRDIYNLGCDHLVFKNNLVVSSVRDEAVALFAGIDKRFNPTAELGKGYIRDCLLENNTFKALKAAEGLDPRVMFLTIGYQLSPVYDIKYINNTFEGYCNSYFLHYCYCEGLTFKGNVVNIRQSGNDKKLTLIWHNDSPHASNIVIEDNIFNLLGDNFKLNSVIMISPYSDASEITFKNNTINLDKGYAETIIAGNAIVKSNVFNLNRVGSIYYRTCKDISDNVYNINELEKSVFEFYNADVKHNLVLKKEKIYVKKALSNLLMFNGNSIKFNGHSLLFEDVYFGIDEVERDYYHLAWSTENILDTVVPITFKNCYFGAYEGHLQIVNGNKHLLKIEE